MTKNWKHVGQVTVTDQRGTVYTFDSLEIAVGYFPRRDIESLTGKFYAPINPVYIGFFAKDPYEFRDELGLVIPTWKIKEVLRTVPPRAPRWRSWIRDNYEFRSGPVPLTGGKRWGRWYRHPRTFQEIREGTRRSKKLPTSWDDIHRDRDRCWKSNRKTQWKAK